MPNLVGIWRSTAAGPGPLDLLERQIARVQTRFRPYRTYRVAGDTWAAALVDHGLLENGHQPGTSGDARFRVLLDGEVLNLGELAARHRIAVASTSGAADVCAELICRCGIDVVREFNGLFALVVRDDTDDRLLLVTDRFGFRPLFLRASGDGICFATELKGVLAACGERAVPDPTAICEQLVYGVHFSGRTWLQGCERVPPATIVTLQRDGESRRRYWTYRYRYDSPPADADEAATRFAVLLDRAVERCMRGSKRIGMFLSAGYDSRSVAAAIRPHHLPIAAFTFGAPESRDVRLAPLLAERLGLRHFYLRGSGPYLAANAAAIVWRTEGLLPFSNTTSVRFHDVIAREADIILTGFLAEFSGSHAWPALLAARSRGAAIRAIGQRFVDARRERARAVLRGEVFARAEEELRARFAASFEAVENDHPFDVADCWNFLHLQPNGTYQSPAVDRHRFEMRAPHMDAELVEFLLTIPPWMRIEQRVYKLMIARAYPAIRDVPCANSMRPIEPRFWIEYPRMAAELAARRLAAPVRRALGREDRLGREISDLDADFRAEPALRTDLLEPLLADGSLDETIFDLGAVRRLVADHFEGRADQAALLAQLISLGLANRLLVRGESAAVPEDYRLPA